MADKRWWMGFEGKMYIALGLGITDTKNMTEFEHVKDPKIGIAFDDVEVTLRIHKGVKAYEKGLVDYPISFSCPNVKDVTILNNITSYSEPEDIGIIKTALFARHQPISIMMVDPDGDGFVGDYYVFTGDKTEEAADAQQFECEAKPSGVGKGVKRLINHVIVED
ncbi:MAG: hypothetical protein LBJ00_04290 [Planctomycetaceae bacterium]|jgi:hypothetical protein|nr:hypothetical protein [Planctomycetaceae bacterium]